MYPRHPMDANKKCRSDDGSARFTFPIIQRAKVNLKTRLLPRPLCGRWETYAPPCSQHALSHRRGKQTREISISARPRTKQSIGAKPRVTVQLLSLTMPPYRSRQHRVSVGTTSEIPTARAVDLGGHGAGYKAFSMSAGPGYTTIGFGTRDAFVRSCGHARKLEKGRQQNMK